MASKKITTYRWATWTEANGVQERCAETGGVGGATHYCEKMKNLLIRGQYGEPTTPEEYEKRFAEAEDEYFQSLDMPMLRMMLDDTFPPEKRMMAQLWYLAPVKDDA